MNSQESVTLFKEQNPRGHDDDRFYSQRHRFTHYRLVWGFLQSCIVTKPNRTCKACAIQIYDKFQMETCESRYPLYHINCYNILHETIVSKLTEFRHEVLNDLTDDERAELSKTVPI